MSCRRHGPLALVAAVVDGDGAARANLGGNGREHQAFLPSGRLDLAPSLNSGQTLPAYFNPS